MAKPTPKTVLAASVATLAGIGIIDAATASKLKPAELIDGIVAYQGTKDKAYAAVGKLRYFLEQSIAASGAKSTITEVLRTKAGLTPGTISNTAYGSKVFALTVGKDAPLTEADYDGLKFAECYAICRAMSPDAKRKLGGAEVAELVRSSRATLEDELQSLTKTGLTLAEATAEAEKVQAEQQRLEAEKKQAAEDAKKNAPGETSGASKTAEGSPQGSAGTPNQTPIVTSETPAPTETDATDPAPSEATSAPSEQPAEEAAHGTSGGREPGEQPEPTPTPTTPTSEAAPTPEAKKEATPPSNVTPMPPAPPTAEAVFIECCDDVDALMAKLATLPPAMLADFYEKKWLPETNTLVEAIKAAEPEPTEGVRAKKAA